jgi:glycosyltransferase involved in cell wall biosynthesis
MSELTISVAMCTFNGKQFLGAQLESIGSQSRRPGELVICDDGSIDGSVELIREFARQAKFPTRVVVNQRNLGSSKNFEQAISLCQSKIVALADQDDVWYPHKLEQIGRTFAEFPSAALAFSDADLIDDNKRLVGRRLWSTFSFNRSEQNEFANGHALKVLLKRPIVTGATMAFRRELFDLANPIPEGHVHDAWISFLLSAYGPFRLIPEPLMQYRQHGAQQMGPGPFSLRQQMARARSTGADSYFDQIERLRQLDERLKSRGGVFPRADFACNEINKKVSHLEHRARLHGAMVARIPNIAHEAFNGNYWRYSTGWKSIAKDLLIR